MQLEAHLRYSLLLLLFVVVVEMVVFSAAVASRLRCLTL